MNQEKIGKFIQTLRKEKNLTQNELAEKLGVSNRAVSKWENGNSMPDLSLFKPLCEILGTSINELMNGERSNSIIPDTDNNIINTINIANEKHITDVVGYFIYKILGVILLIIGYAFLNINYSFPIICLIVGGIFIIVSTLKLTKSLKLFSKIIINLFYVVFTISLLFIIDNIRMSNDDSSLIKPKLYIFHKNYAKYEYYSTFTGRYYFCKFKNEEFFYNFIYYADRERKIAAENYCNEISN